MNYIYHAIPEPMIGDELVPLNAMQSTMAEIRKRNLQKYQGREELLERKVPLLDCLWNDVVHFLPLHPQKVFELQKSFGLIDTIPPYCFYEIEINKLDVSQTILFFKTAPGKENVSVKWLNEVDLSLLNQVPIATREYYKSLVGTGESPFNYQFIPHVLHRGAVTISDARIIRLKDAE